MQKNDHVRKKTDKGKWNEVVVVEVSDNSLKVKVKAYDETLWKLQSSNNFEKLVGDSPDTMEQHVVLKTTHDHAISASSVMNDMLDTEQQQMASGAKAKTYKNRAREKRDRDKAILKIQSLHHCRQMLSKNDLLLYDPKDWAIPGMCYQLGRVQKEPWNLESGRWYVDKSTGKPQRLLQDAAFPPEFAEEGA
jgi:hypothetical protein